MAKEKQAPGLIPAAIGTGFYRSVEQVLRARFPEQMNRWDCWDYKIYGPLSFCDEARLTVYLINRDKSKQEVVLAL